jgi:hypothetical protein
LQIHQRYIPGAQWEAFLEQQKALLEAKESQQIYRVGLPFPFIDCTLQVRPSSVIALTR